MRTPASVIRRLVVLTATCALATAALAVDSGYNPNPNATGGDTALAPARERIAAKDWAGAQAALQRANATASADWNNLMGYTMRKRAQPDLAAAGRYYDTALRIDPQHRGALAYSGELALQQNDVPRAQQRLDKLKDVCGAQNCAEYVQLRDAVQRHPAR